LNFRILDFLFFEIISTGNISTGIISIKILFTGNATNKAHYKKNISYITKNFQKMLTKKINSSIIISVGNRKYRS
jgi:hypothetical protein